MSADGPSQVELPLGDVVPRGLPIAPARRVFCNRNLRLERIELVGFDMDYTLAIYVQDEMDRLSIEVTARKLVERGYPEVLLTMRVEPRFPIRGLLVDRKLGNVLKMDRYRYVKRAYHGLRELPREERRALYHQRRLRPGTARYHWVDTLYALSEVAVYAGAIEALEALGEPVDYDALFGDVRECIDLAHQDGSILDVVAANFPRFVERDPRLGPTLHRLRSAGKRLFLLTNSQPGYTDAVMRYLLDGAMPGYASWRSYFDLIITAARKPGFFTEDEPFHEVLADGSTRPAQTLERGRIYRGGSLAALERMAGTGGDHVLYVGDHIYGDVLRAKKETAWRTAMIIPELDAELEALRATAPLRARIEALEELRAALEDELHERQARLRGIEERIGAAGGRDVELEAARTLERRAIEGIRRRLRPLDAELDGLEERVERAFHPYWGSLLKAGPELSSFGDQVEQFACLYAARVSSFHHYSPWHYFRSPSDRMPHEL
ncbi:MAG: HAD-IG family 5'-nucleotidase [Myxococcota bacterium]|nr:HAD-IG family 5'-nucleotidase [Myxococcota bacterium]MDW8363955.1 HAD-IG family 5'-nucleotidase [Myxococcales bacterium]